MRLSTADVQPVRQKKAAEIVAGELRRVIVETGRPGDHLPPERVLLERFQISRPTLREALRVLESEGLIEIRRGARGGAVIRETSIHDLARSFGVFLQRREATLEDLFVARAIIEPAAARLAATRIDDGAAARLDEILEAEGGAIEAGKHQMDLTALATQFHDVLLALSGNAILVAFGQLLDEVIVFHAPSLFPKLGTARSKARLETLRASHQAHKRLASAIKRGEAPRAEKLARDHLTAQYAALGAVGGGGGFIDMFGPRGKQTKRAPA